MKIEKTFPADCSLDIKTFLNDAKMDGELYSYLLTLSKGIKDKTGKGITYIDNKDFPPATKIASKLNKCR